MGRALVCASVILLLVLATGQTTFSQTVYVVDGFDAAGSQGYSYSGGQISSVWKNWFGSGFQSLNWDSTSDASNNPSSGSMKIINNSGVDQCAIYNGFFVLSINANQYTNLTLDIRFDPASTRRTNADSSVDFGALRIGTWAANYSQDWIYYFTVPATNTNWVHLVIPLNPVADPNLTNITDVVIGFDRSNPSANSVMTGSQIFWVDNIQFVGPGPVVAGNCQIDWANLRQRIDGFGASSAWFSSMSTHDADLYFSTNTGMGFSLLRSHIYPNGSTTEAAIMQMAVARGAKVWSSPWSPPTNYKNTNSVNGGNFVSSVANYQGYAAQLAGYVANMKNNYGLNLYALSIQNEPDYITTNYESCGWSAQQFHDFLPYLSAALIASNVSSTKIVMPEDEHWQFNLATTAMNDTNTANLVGILAGHNYGSSAAAVTGFGTPVPKPLWETEHYFGTDDTITNGVQVAVEIHSFLTVANVNAYHYWWLTAIGTEGIAGSNTFAPAKRLYAMGNYSKFIRPNYYRINATNASSALISAYKDPVTGNFVIVAVNTNSVAVQQTFAFTNFVCGTLTPYLTSSQNSLAGLASVSTTNGSFSYALPAMSVVTFTGAGRGNIAPTFNSVANQSINPGASVSISNILQDVNQPPLNWNFNLANGPSNATVNPSNGLFAWRALLSQANTTNTVVITASSTNVSGIGATNNFKLLVNPLAPAQLTTSPLPGGQMQLNLTGPGGPDYTLQTATNLASGTPWSNVYFLSSPGSNFNYAVGLSNEPSRFYRVKLGP